MTLVVGAILFLTLSVMSLLSRSSEHPQGTHDRYFRSDRRKPESVPGLREVCRSVLNTHSLRFVAANAPAEVVSSYGTQQQRLARLSLQVASAMLAQRLANEGSFVNGSSGTLQSPVSRLKDALLLGVCTVGRLGLAIVRGLSAGTPQWLQILVSAKILTNVGNLLVDTERGDKPTSKALSRERILSETSSAVSREESSRNAVREDVMRALRVSLPNDLSRLIF